MAKPIKYLPWEPRHLPAMVRHETEALYARVDANRMLPSTLGGDVTDEFVELARQAQDDLLDTINLVAGMEYHWLAPSTCALAMDLSEDFDPEADLLDLFPSPSGLIIWEGGVGVWPAITPGVDNPWGSRGPIPVDGARWSVTDEGVIIAPIFRTANLAWVQQRPNLNKQIERCHQLERQSAIAFNTSSFGYPLAGEIDGNVRGLIAALWATLVLIDQGEGQLTNVDPVRVRQRHPKAGRGLPSDKTREVRVNVIDMLHRPQPSPSIEGGEGKAWVLARRHLVRAHIRSQPYGPGRSLRRPVLIAPYMKGPEGAPFVHADRVHLWRT